MRILAWLITLSVCVVVTIALGGIKYLQISSAMAAAAAFPPPYETVTVAQVEETDWTPVRRLTGTVRAPQFVNLVADETGRIIELPHPAGSVVEAGDVLLKLFDEDLTAQREAVAAEQKLVSTQLKRIEQLKSQSLASQDQFDTLMARSQSLQAQGAALEARMRRLVIRASFAGRLGIYTQSVGDIMQDGEFLTTLTGLEDERWIDFKVPQGVAMVREGDTVRIFDIDDQLVGEATVMAVADALTAGIRAFDVRAKITGPALRHGELVYVEVRSGRNRNAFRVPNNSVRWNMDGPHVFEIIDAEPDSFQDHTAVLRKVSVLGEQNGEIFLVGDIEGGDRIAVQGAFKLYEGALVAVASPARSGK
ncbi:hypothetical protein NOR51B_987 [Luminiphilus syltensis NOR5-1B]|uniref:Efflux transporter, RND family, MFP subunit n=1 Tax=Luminiphilus syltensis NOR5-1B TaxID=565045 RepID=B8KUM9_9GAMM|nr:efflux RND transporter periplasmic adaptor subunit [Luminiphilus syltensis]EED35045.1 hypothetical protein NOR51B_987 [Luminiphilus syltensis NOR5-1B]